MSFEVEVKYRATNGHADLSARLAALGAARSDPVAQADIYLTHPARDFRATNEAFRIRRVGDANFVTYKGPRRAGPTKTREEIEIAFAEGASSFDQLMRLFERLGFGTVATVRKTRTPFHLTFHERPIEVVLDDVDHLGAFAEVEALAGSEADLPDAQSAVLELAGRLGLTETEPRSYLGLLLQRS